MQKSLRPRLGMQALRFKRLAHLLNTILNFTIFTRISFLHFGQ